MKIKKISYIVSFLSVIFLSSLSFVTPSIVRAQSCPDYCSQMERAQACALSNCRQLCQLDCSGGIPTNWPEPTSGTESITGKIFNPVLPENLSTLQGTAFLSKLLRTGISLLLVFGSIIFLFILTSGGVKWLSSSGDKVKLESAQKQITSGLTGLAILLTTFVIIQLVQTIFGIDLLNITLPTL